MFTVRAFALLSLFVLVSCTDDGVPPPASNAPTESSSPASVDAAGASESGSSRAVELRLAYIPGKTYRAETSMSMSSNMTVAGEVIEQRMDGLTTVRLTCRPAATGDGKEVSIQYEKFAMTSSTGGQRFEMSTSPMNADGSPNPMSEMLAPLTESELTLDLDANDEIIQIRGVAELKKQYASNPMVAPLFDQVFGEDQLNQMLNVWIRDSLPEGPVSVGDSWPVALGMPTPGLGEVRIDGTYRLTGFEVVDGASCAVIAVDTAVSVEAGTESSDALPMDIQKGSQTGKIWWDPELRYLRKSEIVQELTMGMEDPMSPETIEVPMSMRIDTHVTVE